MFDSIVDADDECRGSEWFQAVVRVENPGSKAVIPSRKDKTEREKGYIAKGGEGSKGRMVASAIQSFEPQSQQLLPYSRSRACLNERLALRRCLLTTTRLDPTLALAPTSDGLTMPRPSPHIRRIQQDQ